MNPAAASVMLLVTLTNPPSISGNFSPSYESWSADGTLFRFTLVSEGPRKPEERDLRDARRPRDNEARFEEFQRRRAQERGEYTAKRRVDTQAADVYLREPDRLRGRDPADAENEFDRTLVADAGWTKRPLRDGNGVRYTDGKGGLVELNQGYPNGLEGGGGDKIHQGPYVKINPGDRRIPLAGNPELTGG